MFDLLAALIDLLFGDDGLTSSVSTTDMPSLDTTTDSLAYVGDASIYGVDNTSPEAMDSHYHPSFGSTEQDVAEATEKYNAAADRFADVASKNDPDTAEFKSANRIMESAQKDLEFARVHLEKS